MAEGRAVLLALLCACASASSSANSSANGYWDAHRQGWFWYVGPAVQTPAQPYAETEVDAPVAEVPSEPEEPLEVAAHGKLRRRLEVLRSVAVMSPTPANMRAYLVVQKEALDRSSLFADVWQRVVWTNPDLDYSLAHRPTNAAAIRTHEEFALRKRGDFLADAAQDHGLFFLFGPSCVHCEQMGAVVRRFSDRHGMSVRAVALDGAVLAQFPDAWRDNGFAAALGVSALPAVYLARLESGGGSVEPVAFGPLSDAQLDKRVAVLVGSRPGIRF